jgi:hypothetical protein
MRVFLVLRKDLDYCLKEKKMTKCKNNVCCMKRRNCVKHLIEYDEKTTWVDARDCIMKQYKEYQPVRGGKVNQKCVATDYGARNG